MTVYGRVYVCKVRWNLQHHRGGMCSEIQVFLIRFTSYFFLEHFGFLFPELNLELGSQIFNLVSDAHTFSTLHESTEYSKYPNIKTTEHKRQAEHASQTTAPLLHINQSMSAITYAKSMHRLSLTLRMQRATGYAIAQKVQ